MDIGKRSPDDGLLTIFVKWPYRYRLNYTENINWPVQYLYDIIHYKKHKCIHHGHAGLFYQQYNLR